MESIAENLGLTTRFAETENSYAIIRNSLIGEIRFIHEKDGVWYNYKDMCHAMNISEVYLDFLKCVSNKNSKWYYKENDSGDLFVNAYGLAEVFDAMTEDNLPQITLLCKIIKKYIEDYYSVPEKIHDIKTGETPSKKNKPAKSREQKDKENGKSHLHLIVSEEVANNVKKMARMRGESINAFMIELLEENSKKWQAVIKQVEQITNPNFVDNGVPTFSKDNFAHKKYGRLNKRTSMMVNSTMYNEFTNVCKQQGFSNNFAINMILAEYVDKIKKKNSKMKSA